jgi:AmmeMemoRadiSam system protein A
VTPERSLVAATAEVAAAAATRDPRFLPVPPAEVDELEMEISILSVAIPAAAAEVDPVRHGVCLRLGRRRAVFLPQVAAREGWDRETLLDHLSEKAGLAAHAWRDPEAAFLVFTVERVSGPLRYAAAP